MKVHPIVLIITIGILIPVTPIPLSGEKHVRMNRAALAPRDSGWQTTRNLVNAASITSFVPVNREMWFCGGEGDMVNDIISAIGYYTIADGCGEVMPDFNACCAIHDECYEHGPTQKYCDDAFDDCLVVASQFWEKKTCAVAYMSIATSVVRKFGGGFFNQSVEKFAFRQFHPIIDVDQLMVYNDVVAQCSYIGKSLSVCSYNHVICELGVVKIEKAGIVQNLKYCNKQFVKCAKNARKVVIPEDRKCFMAIKRFEKLLNGSRVEFLLFPNYSIFSNII